MKVTYCNGKKDICREDDCSKSCPFYDGTGIEIKQTNFGKLKTMDDEEWAKVILRLYVLLADHNFDFGVLFCDGKRNCYDADREIICDDERRIACIKNWLHTPVDAENSIWGKE